MRRRCCILQTLFDVVHFSVVTRVKFALQKETAVQRKLAGNEYEPGIYGLTSEAEHPA